MKILHIGEYVKGGVATYINELLRFQTECEEIKDVYLIVSTKSEKNFNINPQKVHYYEYSRNLVSIIGAIIEINRFIKKKQPDIIHIHSSFAGFFSRILYFFKKQDVKIIYCSHGWSFLMDSSRYKKYLYTIVERLLSLKTDLIINISKNEHLEALNHMIPKNKCVMIYNGISEIENKIKKPNIFLEKTKINLLFVGRLDKQKGIDLLLDIFKNNRLNDVKLYVIGARVVSNITLEFSQNVIELGWIEADQIDAYYDLFDAIIMPSRWEGFGLVALEAMKRKKAVIASNRGALPEIIQNRVNGLIFDIERPDELIELLINLNKKQLRKMGENGYVIYKKNFTAREMNVSILNEYLKLMSTPYV